MKKEPLENGIELLTRFAGMECESPDYCPLIQKIITYTAKHGDEKAGGEKLEEAVRRVFSQAFVNCLYAYASSLKDSLMSTLKQLAAWLTPAQKITVSGVSLRVGEAMKEAESLSGLKCLKKLQYAKTGTDEQEKIVRDVIHYAREHDKKAKIPGMNIRDLAEKALLGVYAENANQFQQYESKGCRSVMHTIASVMPRSMELPGSGMTLWEFEDRIEPSLALTRIRPRIEKDSFEEKDAACIAYYLDKWPDFDMGGQSFKEIALSFARAMMIQAANRIQRSSGSEQKKWKAILCTTTMACSGQPDGISDQEAKAIQQIAEHYDLKSADPCSSYYPLYPPLSSQDYNAKAKKAGKNGRKENGKGLFARIRHLF
ncbi:MAG: hypothetical protein J5564_06390 [Clostridia bacterium]|nr:hypothetical protein [Clostridia bacterium]